jgi:hypothetical protein
VHAAGAQDAAHVVLVLDGRQVGRDDRARERVGHHDVRAAGGVSAQELAPVALAHAQPRLGAQVEQRAQRVQDGRVALVGLGVRAGPGRGEVARQDAAAGADMDRAQRRVGAPAEVEHVGDPAHVGEVEVGRVGTVDHGRFEAVDEHPLPAVVGRDHADGGSCPSLAVAPAAPRHRYRSASGAVRSSASQPTSCSRISSSARAPPRRPNSRLA